MDSWDKEQYLEAESIFEREYKDEKIESIEDLSGVIADLMIKYGPYRHCDGNEIIALNVWRLLKNDPTAKPDYNSQDSE